MTTTSDLRSRLESQEAELHDITQKIEHRLEEYVDWKGLVHHHPLKSIGAAVGIGFVLSGAVAPLLNVIAKNAGATITASSTAYVGSLIRDIFRTPVSRVR